MKAKNKLCTRRKAELMDELMKFLFEDEEDRKGRDT